MRTLNETRPPAFDLAARDVLPADMLNVLCSHFPPARVEYIAHVLTVDELRVMGDLRDALILARIKRMPEAKLDRLDRMMPRTPDDHRFYHAVQAEWLRREQYLLGTRLGRCPTHKELFMDFLSHRNGRRFRAYFAMKYPHRVRPGEQTHAA